MTRTRLTYLIVFVLLAAAGVWVARNTYWEETVIPMPPQGDAATNPFYSVQHLATALGIHSNVVLSLNAMPPDTGVLLVDGFQDDVTHTHVDALMRWVAGGGRLIVNDYMVRSDAKLQEWSQIHLGTRFTPAKDEKDKKAQPKSINPEDECAPLDVTKDGRVTGGQLTLCLPPSEFGLVSTRKLAWGLANHFGLQVLRVNIGKGSLTVIPRYYLIANKNLLRHDHAQIFIAASNLARGDGVWIVNAAHAEQLLAMIWRLAAPALVFFGLAILCIVLREIPRFGPPIPAPALVRRSLAEQIRANAAFAWRTRKLAALRAAMRRALDETAKQRIAAYAKLDQRTRVDRIAARVGTDAATLNAAMTEDAAASPPMQRAAISLLEQTRRILNKEDSKLDRGPV